MIKKLFICIFLLLNLNAYASFITEEGYENFLIGKTSLLSVYENYPEIKPGIADANDSTQVISFYFIDKGIELFFMSKQSDAPGSIYLFQIDITAPCLAVTKNNIGVPIGIGSKETVLKKYGTNITGKEQLDKSNLYFYGRLWVSTQKGKVERISITDSTY